MNALTAAIVSGPLEGAVVVGVATVEIGSKLRFEGVSDRGCSTVMSFKSVSGVEMGAMMVVDLHKLVLQRPSWDDLSPANVEFSPAMDSVMPSVVDRG